MLEEVEVVLVVGLLAFVCEIVCARFGAVGPCVPREVVVSGVVLV